MIVDMGYWTRVIKNIFVFFISIIAIFLMLKLAIFYIPFLIGFIISIIIEPLIILLKNKTKFNRKVSATIVLIFIFAILIGLITWGIFSIVNESSNLLNGLNDNIEKIYSKIEYYINSIQSNNTYISQEVFSIIEKSTSNLINFLSNIISNSLTNTLQFITKIPIIGIYFIITILSTYLICTDRIYILDQIEHHFPRIWVKKFTMHTKDILSSLGSYLKAEVILVAISFVIVLIRIIFV